VERCSIRKDEVCRIVIVIWSFVVRSGLMGSNLNFCADHYEISCFSGKRVECTPEHVTYFPDICVMILKGSDDGV
jgi:hypothetical protein